MIWFAKFFNKEKFQNSQYHPSESKRQDFTGVMQAVVEETVMATAYWLIKLVNTSLENKVATQVEDDEKAPVTSTNALEDLVPKVVALIEQSSDRSQTINALEIRLQIAETALKESLTLEQSKQVSIESFTVLENRLSEIEALVKKFEVAQETSDRSNQSTTALEARIAHLEKLLGRYSMVPKLIEQHRQAIATLQHRLTIVESPQTNNHHKDREKFPVNSI